MRFTNRQYLDAINVIARHGKPDLQADLFIMFTTNPNWPEINNNLAYKQKWSNRPDLVCRGFHIRLTKFMDDIVKK